MIKRLPYLFVINAILLRCFSIVGAEETALDRYIAKPDDSYHWELKNTIPGDDADTFILELTSQTWRSEAEVDRPVWTHWLTVVRPKELAHDTAFLYIGEGDNGDALPDKPTQRPLSVAMETHTVSAELRMVPNQPLYFADSPKQGRGEDDLIAYSRVKFIITGDEEWLVRLPMVKSGVRAMDAIQEFMASEAGGKHAIKDFVVAGGSKRAWVTWLVGVEDARVKAIVPFVIDALNTEAVTRHQYEAYGFFSKAVGDYVRHGLYPRALGTPEFDTILKIEDPYMYRDRERLKIPKYLINASGDQYFLPDNSQFYFKDLPEEKYLRYVPNARHNLGGSDARESMLAFYQSILNDTKRPEFSWTIEDDGRIVVDVKDKPAQVNLWQATNPDARDFRLDVIGAAWTSKELKEEFPNRYVGSVPVPSRGYRAYFVELVYDSGFEHPFKFTTDVKVVPDVLPFTFDKNSEIVLK